jgi:hypothetical protein
MFPIYGDLEQPDGRYLTLEDTHFLALIPKELGSLVDFKEKILKSYIDKEWPPGDLTPIEAQSDYQIEHALQFHFPHYLGITCGESFFDTHWVLITKNVIPDSTNKTWEQQNALVESFRQRVGVDYHIPTVQQAVVAIISWKLTNIEKSDVSYVQKRLYEGAKMVVKDVAIDYPDGVASHVTVSNNTHSDRGSVSISLNFNKPTKKEGIALLRTFS